MVERERDGGEAMALYGPRHEGAAAEDEALEGEAVLVAAAAAGEKGEGETDGEIESASEEDAKENEDEAAEKEKKDKEELEEWSEIRLAIAELSPISHGKLSSSPPTLPFLSISLLLLQVLDKIGPTMAVLRLDVQRNIERLQELYLLDPSKYSTLTAMVEKEADEGTARKADSCARAVLWLTRSMDFTVALLQRLEDEEGSENQSLAQLVEAAYKVSLKPWHGWIASAASKIAMKLIPERKVFVGWLVGKDPSRSVLKDEIERLIPLLQPFLVDIHNMLAKFRLDRLKST
ncbi:glycolipid transfer protein 3-like [Lolium rigidum]|uniref:glycolipid transfer protein 3-like n=1 Tax=Lolium rigidum TaxID=89674 RepID=UPI001F5C8D1B|nr:glycolipid transfer protein 3-like [Lolium rigidum]XP_051217434.1 glycolipid transfer protein 3-like isoform X1 [Lolium perenne]